MKFNREKAMHEIQCFRETFEVSTGHPQPGPRTP
jgi:hypothetical protein